MVPNQEVLLELLEKIKEDNNKVLRCQCFTYRQWIQWNADKKCFEYEDNTFLGHTPQEVIKTYEDVILSGAGHWLYTASWYLRDQS